MTRDEFERKLLEDARFFEHYAWAYAEERGAGDQVGLLDFAWRKYLGEVATAAAVNESYEDAVFGWGARA